MIEHYEELVRENKRLKAQLASFRHSHYQTQAALARSAIAGEIKQQPIKPSLAFDASVHLSNWLNMNLCECEGAHTCGYNDVKRTRDALLEAAEQRPAPDVAGLLTLLEHAQCNTCDGSGALYDGHGQVRQCQWCHERSEALLFAAEQQPEPDVIALVEAPINVIYTDGCGAGRRSPADCRYGVRYVTVADTVYWPLSADDAQRLRSAECGRGDFTGPANECPDVSALVEALEQCITSMLDNGYLANALVIRAARAALAAHRKGGEA